MNTRRIIITVLVIALVLGGFFIIKNLVKIPVEPIPPEEAGPPELEERPPLLPENVVPTPQEIEENSKVREEKREVSQKVGEAIARKKVTKEAMQEMLQEEEPQEEEASVVPQEKTAQKPVGPPKRKEVRFPTREEVREMRSHGILTY